MTDYNTSIQTAFIEKRNDHRCRVLKGGTIRFNNGYSTFECRIKNLTNEGAMLELSTTIGIPLQFELLYNDCVSHVSKVIWRDQSRVGVQFV